MSSEEEDIMATIRSLRKEISSLKGEVAQREAQRAEEAQKKTPKKTPRVLPAWYQKAQTELDEKTRRRREIEAQVERDGPPMFTLGSPESEELFELYPDGFPWSTSAVLEMTEEDMQRERLREFEEERERLEPSLGFAMAPQDPQIEPQDNGPLMIGGEAVDIVALLDSSLEQRAKAEEARQHEQIARLHNLPPHLQILSTDSDKEREKKTKQLEKMQSLRDTAPHAAMHRRIEESNRRMIEERTKQGSIERMLLRGVRQAKQESTD